MKTPAKKPKMSERQLRRHNLETLLLINLHKVSLRDCTHSPKWVLSVVKDARKALLRYTR